MGSKEAHLTTTLSVKECAQVFREGAARARGIGSMMGGIAAKVAGNDQSGFFTPHNDSPFASLDEDVPDFTVGVMVPKFSAGAKGNVTALHMYVWDRGATRNVTLYSPHGIGGGLHANKLVSKVSDTFRAADPRCRTSEG